VVVLLLGVMVVVVAVSVSFSFSFVWRGIVCVSVGVEGTLFFNELVERLVIDDELRLES